MEKSDGILLFINYTLKKIQRLCSPVREAFSYITRHISLWFNEVIPYASLNHNEIWQKSPKVSRGICKTENWRSSRPRPIPGKVKLLLVSGKKSASLLDHISRFLSHQFVTWYLRSISKTKIVKFFCPCMSEHMIYIKNVTNVTQTLHQNVTNVTKQNIASKEILTIEFHTKYMKLFVNMLSIICVLLNTKFHNISENF